MMEDKPPLGLGAERFEEVSTDITNSFLVGDWTEIQLELLEKTCKDIPGASVEFFTYDPTPNDPKNKKRYAKIIYEEGGEIVDNSVVHDKFNTLIKENGLSDPWQS